jgi:hypothetical protein
MYKEWSAICEPRPVVKPSADLSRAVLPSVRVRTGMHGLPSPLERSITPTYEKGFTCVVKSGKREDYNYGLR